MMTMRKLIKQLKSILQYQYRIIKKTKSIFLSYEIPFVTKIQNTYIFSDIKTLYNDVDVWLSLEMKLFNLKSFFYYRDTIQVIYKLFFTDCVWLKNYVFDLCYDKRDLNNELESLTSQLDYMYKKRPYFKSIKKAITWILIACYLLMFIVYLYYTYIYGYFIEY